MAPGVDRVDLEVQVVNPAEDHRLRLCFPTGEPVTTYRAATTFDVAERTTDPVDDEGWEHPTPATFAHQGWIEAHGLVVGAPGLPEAEVTTDGVVKVTLLRSVGWLARLDPTTRPIPAGPGLATPEAQCPDGITARLSLRVANGGVGAAHLAAMQSADELGLRAVPAGDGPVVEPGRSLVAIEPAGVVLSALKPAEDGDGLVVRLANPGPEGLTATVAFGVSVAGAESVRLDETPDGGAVILDGGGGRLRLEVGPHGLRSVRVRPG